MKRSLLPLLPLLMVALLLGGCAATVEKTELIPSGIDTYKSTGKTIYISPVTIRPQPKPGFLMDEPPRLDSETLRETIVSTLSQTGLFTEVRIQGEADYILSTDVIGQRQLGALSNVELLLVRYRLTDTSEREIWSGNLFSHFELSASQVFMGIERTRKVLEGATRDNMTKLGNEMSNILTSPGM